MKYVGSKSRIKKSILPILQTMIDENNITTYIEPFVGGANIIDKILCENKIGGDNQEVLIALLKHVQNGGKLPTEVSKELYDDVRKNKNTNKYEKWLIGAVGFLASYNGKYFGGYAGIITTKVGTVRNYYDESKRNLEKQIDDIKNIDFINCDYTFFSDVKNCLIYCDIPYKNTTGYDTSKNFNHESFWEWARKMSNNNIVIVSELESPDDFECIWERMVERTQDNKSRKQSIEKLFIYKGDDDNE